MVEVRTDERVEDEMQLRVWGVNKRLFTSITSSTSCRRMIFEDVGDSSSITSAEPPGDAGNASLIIWELCAVRPAPLYTDLRTKDVLYVAILKLSTPTRSTISAGKVRGYTKGFIPIETIRVGTQADFPVGYLCMLVSR